MNGGAVAPRARAFREPSEARRPRAQERARTAYRFARCPARRRGDAQRRRRRLGGEGRRGDRPYAHHRRPLAVDAGALGPVALFGPGNLVAYLLRFRRRPRLFVFRTLTVTIVSRSRFPEFVRGSSCFSNSAPRSAFDACGVSSRTSPARGEIRRLWRTFSTCAPAWPSRGDSRLTRSCSRFCHHPRPERLAGDALREGPLTHVPRAPQLGLVRRFYPLPARLRARAFGTQRRSGPSSRRAAPTAGLSWSRSIAIPPIPRELGAARAGRRPGSSSFPRPANLWRSSTSPRTRSSRRHGLAGAACGPASTRSEHHRCGRCLLPCPPGEGRATLAALARVGADARGAHGGRARGDAAHQP